MNKSSLVISVRKVSKCYTLYDHPRTRLFHALNPRYRRGMQAVWALRDVDLEVHRGEAVGIIGRNGSGKTTLLEIVTGTLAATSGKVAINGRVSALLELGSGFNPEYTGRDNVLLNGLLLGLTREEISAQFDKIEAFAEIGEAIDRPVKTYSSGMMMRLAFAVQVLCRPEILVIDEALSVGDFFFQQKCLGFIRSLCEQGTTLLFVSHDLGTVRDLCSKALYLCQGKDVFFGDRNDAIRAFLAEGSTASKASSEKQEASKSISAAADIRPLEEALKIALWRRDIGVLHRESQERLLAVVVKDGQGQPTATIEMGSKAIVQIYFRTRSDEEGHVSLIMENKYDQVVSVVGSDHLGLPPFRNDPGGYCMLELELDCRLEAGLYSLTATFGQPTLPNRGVRLDSTGRFGPLHIHWDYEKQSAPFLGQFGIPVRIISNSYMEIP